MPKSTSPRTRNDDWVVVAQFMADGDANACVSFIESAGIPVVRFPVMQSTFAQFPETIRVLVPPDRAEEAEELLKD
ncbi:MAG: hypothetical protein ABFE07_26910 [Armatimonadia bacterium]